MARQIGPWVMEPHALIVADQLRELESRVLAIESWLARLSAAPKTNEWQLRTADGHLIAVRRVVADGAGDGPIRILLDRGDPTGTDDSHCATITAAQARELAAVLLGYATG